MLSFHFRFYVLEQIIIEEINNCDPQQATERTPELRDRYFNALAACTEVVNMAYEKTVGSEFKAHLEAMRDADTVIAVYDPGAPCCEREAAAVAVAEMLNTQVVTVDPKAIHFFKSNLYPIIPYCV